jgi:aerobic carbon-monoxide dehydrogenase large subunit
MSDPKTGFIGKAVERREDYRFLTGAGQYTDDVALPNQSYGYFLRSPHAHARIVAVNTVEAAKAPGVLAVLTGKDFEPVGGLPCGWLINSLDGSPMKEPKHAVLAADKVRYVGDHVALVVAETLAQAKSAAALIEVDYEILPAVADTGTASKAAAAVHDIAPDNVCFVWGCGDKAATDAAFAKAAHVTKLQFVNNRLIPNAIEPRAANAMYSRGDDSYTLYVASQNPHVERLLMTAFVLGLPEHKVRVIAPDVGGGFGSKIYLYAEETALVFASKRVGRPIKWTAERSESFLSDAHGRDHVTVAELALDKDGRFLALREHTTANMGAYLSTFASCIPTILHSTLLAGQYATPAIYSEITAVFTNTAPVDAYRGAGRPEATYLVERLVETAAREMKIDPAELRRRNFIKTFPYATPVGLTYDTGDYEVTLTRAMELADVQGLRGTQGRERKEGPAARARLRGLHRGLRHRAVEHRRRARRAGGPVRGRRGARASDRQGHGLHRLAFARAGSRDDLRAGRRRQARHPMDDVDIQHGDTGKILFGMGTYGSRSLAVGGTAIVKAVDKVIAKGKKIAAHLLEASDADIEFAKRRVPRRRHRPRKTFAEVALTAYVPHNYPLDKLEPGLNENAFYDPTNFTYPAGTYICEVEIDPDTGTREIDRFTASTTSATWSTR